MQDKLQCAIYTRVSTENQAEVEFNSCEAQESKIRSFITSQENMSVFKVYSDPGFTGANLDRPALQELLEDVKQSKISLVIAYKIDRLTRSPKDFYHLIEIFDKYGVNFISVTERFDTSTPSGRLLRNIMLTFAQFERELISERTRDKLQERAQKGMWNGGIVPFGYKAENKKLVIDEVKARIVKNIYEKYIFSNSLIAVYEDLKSKGIAFSKSELSYILRNPSYAGKVRFDGKLYQGLHQPIISEEMFSLAQEIHKKRKLATRMRKDYLFAGLLRCKECGSYMTPCYTNKGKGHRKRRYHYYRCTKTFHRDWQGCSIKQVSANRLENYVFENLERISRDKQYQENLIFRLNTPTPPPKISSTKTPGDGRISFSDSSNQLKENGLLRGQHGYELSQEPPKISGEIFAQTLAAFVKFLSQKQGLEKNLACCRFIKSIIYSKESIQINFFSPLAEKEKSRLEEAGNFSLENKVGCPNWTPDELHISI
jgi:site-specific DNA recombinase